MSERKIRWDPNHRPLCDTLYYYFANQDMVDVTLVCKDGELKAHRMVLCAGSRYFTNVLLGVKLDNRMCMVHEERVTKKTMLMMLEFLYRGEVSVPYSELKLFLDTAAHYDIKEIVITSDSPAKTSVSPAKTNVSPAKTRVSPAKTSVSPAKTSVSPAKTSVSPAKTSVSPAKTSVSPAKTSVSPAKTSVSPAKLKNKDSPVSKKSV